MSRKEFFFYYAASFSVAKDGLSGLMVNQLALSYERLAPRFLTVYA
jgi:hypothetical protein